MAGAWYVAETVQSGQVTGTLTNCPILFSRTSAGPGLVPDFRTVGNGGRVIDLAGKDLILLSGIPGVGSLLDQETERYNAATGLIEKYARASSLAVGSVFYWSYGDASITTSQDNKTGVWSTSYDQLVAHYPDGTTLSASDSAGGHNGTITGAAAIAGRVGSGAASFSAASHIIDFGSSIANLGTNRTWSGWFRRPSGGASGDRFVMSSRWTNNATNRQIFIYFNPAAGGDQFRVDIPFIEGIFVSAVSYAFNEGVWHHWAVTKSGTTWRLYVDKVEDANSPHTQTFPPETGGTVTVGNWVDNGGITAVRGDLDETREGTVTRTANEVAAEYNSMSAPATFWGSLGNEVQTIFPKTPRRLFASVTVRRSANW